MSHALRVYAFVAVAAATASAQPGLKQFSQQLAELSARVRPSVVQILSNGYAAAGDSDSGGAAAVRQSSGSGFILSAEGLILTNAHVVTGATRVRVYLPLKNSVEAGVHSAVRPRGPLVSAKVLGLDTETDIALLKVEWKDPLPALQFADPESVRQGQLVLAMGHPLGLEEAVALGVISATARQLKPDDPLIYIQTDAPINPGNSGGPLIDMEGRVVGINTLILTQSGGSEGVGFAVPANIVRTVSEQLRTQGRVRRSFIGVEAQTITPGLAAGLGLKQDRGVILSDVMPGGPADQGGLQPGDIVLELNGRVMENARQFVVNVYRAPPMTDLRIKVLREGAERIQNVQAVELPGDPDRLTRLVDQNLQNIPRLGVLALAIDDKVADLLGELRKKNGILVASRALSVTDASGALAPGDVIYSMDRKELTSLEQFRQLLDAHPPGDTVVLQIERGGKLRYLEIVLD